MIRSLSFMVLVALVLGLGVGAWVQWYADPQVHALAEMVEAFGGLWLNALRMTVVPLVFSLLVTGIASVADAASTGKLAARAIALFAILLAIAACYSVAATSGLLALWPVDRVSASAILSGVVSGEAVVAEAPSFSAWLQALVPANALRAAAEDAVLPLVVFRGVLRVCRDEAFQAGARSGRELLPRHRRDHDRDRALGAAGGADWRVRAVRSVWARARGWRPRARFSTMSRLRCW